MLGEDNFLADVRRREEEEEEAAAKPREGGREGISQVLRPQNEGRQAKVPGKFAASFPPLYLSTAPCRSIRNSVSVMPKKCFCRKNNDR